MAKYEFAIKKNLLNSGKVVHIPVCREKTKFFGIFFSNPWNRIVKIYDTFTLLELDFIPELSHGECEDHIKGYQEALAKVNENDVAEVYLNNLEEVET